MTKKKFTLTASAKEELMAWLFLSPTVVAFLVFVALPIITAFTISFFNWDPLTGLANIKFVGLKNFEQLISDKTFWFSLRITFTIVIAAVPIMLSLSLIIALLLNQRLFLRGFIRMSVFVPYITTNVAVAMVFVGLFHRDGFINMALSLIGNNNPPFWLANDIWALVAIIIIVVWKDMGYCMIIYLAGLQSIPRVYYEAASIDGASTLRKIFHITIPLVTPTTFFLLVIQSIAVFRIFDIVRVLTGGGPFGSTNVIINNIYQNAFLFNKLGYSSAMALVFFLIILSITLLQWIGEKHWVNYEA